MADCFYVPAGEDTWLATVHTTGPWDARAQHGGPPSALLGRAIQRCAPRDDMIVARVTTEILGAVPVGEIRVQARLARPGRRVELLEAVASAGGRDVARAAAWRVLRTQSPAVPSNPPPPPPLPEAASAGPALAGQPPGSGGWLDGYLSAIEWRPVRGHFTQRGPASVWARMRYPLVADEEPGPLERVLVVADSGSGASGELDVRHWLFINPELTVHLHREAAGEWVCLDARTVITAGGAGLATSMLFDEHGPLGVGAQSLLVAPRQAAE